MVDQVLARREAGLRLKAQAVLFRAAHHSMRLEIEAHPAKHPLREVRRSQVSRAAPSRTCWPCCAGRKTPRPPSPASGPFSSCRPRPQDRRPHPRQPPGGPAGCLLLAEQPVPDSARSAWLVCHNGRGPARQHHLASPIEQLAQWYEGEIERLFDDAPVRQADIQQLARIAATYPSLNVFSPNSPLTRRMPPATIRAPAPRRGLPDPPPSTRPKGRAVGGVAAQHRGWLPALRPRHRQRTRDRRRNAPVLRGHDPRKDHLDFAGCFSASMSLAKPPWRPPRLCRRTHFIPSRLLGYFDQLGWPPASLPFQPPRPARRAARTPSTWPPGCGRWQRVFTPPLGHPATW